MSNLFISIILFAGIYSTLDPIIREYMGDITGRHSPLRGPPRDEMERYELRLPPADPALMADFKARLVAGAAQIMRGGEIASQPLHECARPLLNGFEPCLPTNLSGVAGILALNQLGEMVAAPRGEFMVMNCVSLPPQLTHARIQTKTWKTYPYLNELKVHGADIVTIEAPAGQIGISFRGCAFTDPRLALTDSESMFDLIAQSYGAINPYFQELYPLMAGDGFDARKYGMYFNELRNRHHELSHARDWAFSSALMDNDYSDGIGIEHTQSLYKPNSELWKKVEMMHSRPSEVATTRVNFLFREYSAFIGGIISEMRKHLAARKPDLAFMAFLDYMGTHEITRGFESQYEQIEGFVGALHFDCLATIGLSSPLKVLSSVRSGVGTPAVNALRLLERLRDLDMWNDEQRAELVAARGAHQ